MSTYESSSGESSDDEVDDRCKKRLWNSPDVSQQSELPPLGTNLKAASLQLRLLEHAAAAISEGEVACAC